MQSRSARKGSDSIRILNSIRFIVRALRLFDRETLSRSGISAAQISVLHALSEGDGISLSRLAEITSTDQSSASVVVQRLVTSGHVKRSISRSDRRRVELRLTRAGRKLVRKSPRSAQEKVLKSVGTLSAFQRKQLAALMEKLVGGMSLRGQLVGAATKPRVMRVR